LLGFGETVALLRFVSPNHIFTLPPGGSDAVAAGEAGEGGGSFGVWLLVAQTLHQRDPVTDWLRSALPSLRLGPPRGRVKSNLVFVVSSATLRNDLQNENSDKTRFISRG